MRYIRMADMWRRQPFFSGMDVIVKKQVFKFQDKVIDVLRNVYLFTDDKKNVTF